MAFDIAARLGYPHPQRMLRDLSFPEFMDWAELLLLGDDARQAVQQEYHQEHADLIKRINQAPPGERNAIYREFADGQKEHQ